MTHQATLAMCIGVMVNAGGMPDTATVKATLEQLYKASIFNRLLTLTPSAIKRETQGICRAPVGSKSERQIMPSAITAQEKLWWMIYTLRASISLDWAKLAVEILTSDERKTITDRLIASTKALKEIKNTLRRMPAV